MPSTPQGKSKRPSMSLLDIGAIGLSGLCVAHCLLLPVAFAALPLVSPTGENHLVHQVLVLIAAPVTLWALGRSGGWKRPAVLVPALIGFVFLTAGAYVTALEAHETLLTITGALLIALAHLLNWRHVPHGHDHDHAHAPQT